MQWHGARIILETSETLGIRDVRFPLPAVSTGVHHPSCEAQQDIATTSFSTVPSDGYIDVENRYRYRYRTEPNRTELIYHNGGDRRQGDPPVERPSARGFPHQIRGGESSRNRPPCSNSHLPRYNSRLRSQNDRTGVGLPSEGPTSIKRAVLSQGLSG